MPVPGSTLGYLEESDRSRWAQQRLPELLDSAALEPADGHLGRTEALGGAAGYAATRELVPWAEGMADYAALPPYFPVSFFGSKLR